MKLTTLATLAPFALATLSGCVSDRPAAAPIGQTQTTSGLICSTGRELNADGTACVKRQMPQVDVP